MLVDSSRRFVLALLVLGGSAACVTAPKQYRSFQDVPYGYEDARTIWAPRAGLELHLAEMKPEGSQDKMPVVLLHPWGLNMTVWADVVPSLAKDRPVLLVDLPGHGKSTKVFSQYPMRRLATSVLDAMDHAGVDRAIIMGNSLGGATALALSLLAPERIHAVVAVGAPGSGELPVPLQRAARLYVQPQQLQHVAVDWWWVGMQIAQRSSSSLAQRIRNDMIGVTYADEWAAWCKINPLILQNVAAYAPPLETISTPVLVVTGSSDLVVFPDTQRKLAARLPNSTYVELEGCGHLPEIECPQLLMPEVTTFLASVDPDDTGASLHVIRR